MMLLWVFFQPTQQTHLRITLVRDLFLAARNCCMCKIIRSRNYSPSYQVHMFPRAVMSSFTAYGAVVCIRGLASFSGISTEFVLFFRVSILRPGHDHTDKRIRFCDKILREVLRNYFAESLSRGHTAILHRIHCSFSSFCTATWCRE